MAENMSDTRDFLASDEASSCVGGQAGNGAGGRVGSGMRNRAGAITNPQEAAEALAQLFATHQRVVFFGGAGVSTASGIPDFRSADGLYNQKFNYPPEVMLSHSFYETHRAEFFEFYREKMLALWAKPNQCHLKLAELERAGNLSAVVTQNIDGLHQAAGSQRVYELHGSVHHNVCQRCGRVYSAEWVCAQAGGKGSQGAGGEGSRGAGGEAASGVGGKGSQGAGGESPRSPGGEASQGAGGKDLQAAIPICENCGGPIKPDVVLYEEPLNETVVRGAVEAIAQADALVIGGTSLVVYPAASFIDYFNGRTLAIVNLQPTPQDTRANLRINCDIAKAFDF